MCNKKTCIIIAIVVLIAALAAWVICKKKGACSATDSTDATINPLAEIKTDKPATDAPSEPRTLETLLDPSNMPEQPAKED